MSTTIPFIDLNAQRQRIGNNIEQAIKRVLDHGGYIMGPEIIDLEKALSSFCGAKYTITCSSGTDALLLILMAMGVSKGDAILIPTFTFAATAEVVALLGATPVFVDIKPDSFNVDPTSLEAGIKVASALGLHPRALISVDLFGLPAEYSALEAICHQYSIELISDAAQSFGAVYKNRNVGTLGIASATSFFPAKPLGCYGDGGAIFTNDDNLLKVIKSLRVHGQGSDKYDNVRVGINGRLDTLQAAILLEKLSIFSDELSKRREVARYYNEHLQDLVQVPILDNGETLSAWAQYSLILREGHDRNNVIEKLNNDNIPTAIYYPKPLHQQSAYRHYPKSKEEGLKTAEIISQKIMSLPMHPYLERQTQDYIIEKLRNILE